MRIYRILLSFSLSLCLSFSLGAKSFAGFEQLPLEVVSHIFSYLDAKELRQSGPINRACAGEAVEVNRRRWLAKVRKIEAIWTKFGPFIALPGGGELSPPITQELWIEVLGVSAAIYLDESVTNKENCPTTYRELIPATDGKIARGICPDFPVVLIYSDEIDTEFSYYEQYHDFKYYNNFPKDFWKKLNRIYQVAGLAKEWRLQTPEEYFWADTEGGRNPKQATDLNALTKFTPWGGRALRSIQENIPNQFGFRRSGLPEATEDLVPWGQNKGYRPHVYLVGGGYQATAEQNASDLTQWDMYSRLNIGFLARLVKIDLDPNSYAYTRVSPDDFKTNPDQSVKEKVGVGRLRQLQKERDWWRTAISQTPADLMIQLPDPALRGEQARAYYSYSNILRRGIGGEKDKTSANWYFLRALEAGSDKALSRLRKYLFDPDFKDVNLQIPMPEIIQSLLKGASHNNFANLILSEIYLNELSPVKNENLAKSILENIRNIPEEFGEYYSALQLKRIERSVQGGYDVISHLSPYERALIVQTLLQMDSFRSRKIDLKDLSLFPPLIQPSLETLVQGHPRDAFILFLYSCFLKDKKNYELAAIYAARSLNAGERQARFLIDKIIVEYQSSKHEAARERAPDPTPVKKFRGEEK